MSQQFKFKAENRTQNAATVRGQGAIPAVLYGPKQAAKSLQVDSRTFQQIYEQAGSTSLVKLGIVDEDQDHTVLIRDVQHHPVTDQIIHVDFYQVRLDQAIHAQVPLNFIGEAPAVKDLGGVLVRNLDEVDLEAKPEDLPHDIEVDISGLNNFDAVIHISDLKLTDGVKLHHEEDEVIALVQAPRTEAELEALEEEVSEEVSDVEGVEKPETAGGEEGTDQGNDDATIPPATEK